MTPRRLMTLHFLQILLTDGRTFMLHLMPFEEVYNQLILLVFSSSKTKIHHQRQKTRRLKLASRIFQVQNYLGEKY